MDDDKVVLYSKRWDVYMNDKRRLLMVIVL